MLEYKALCMILTLRRFFGDWSRCPIYAYSPRRSNIVSSWMLDVYRHFDVIPVIENINTDFVDYPLANKPICMAHAECELGSEFLVFLDSDILCWRQPDLFDIGSHADLAMTVDTTKSVASSGLDDPLDSVWNDLYRVFGSNPDIFVTTSLDEKRVRGWWGSGVIVVRRNSGLMGKWLEGFVQAMTGVKFPETACYLREQMTMSALALSCYARFVELPISYNYQVQNYSFYSEKGVSPDKAILWHYQPYFDREFRKFSKLAASKSTVSEKIAAAEVFVKRLRESYPEMIGLDESMMQVFKKKIHIRKRVQQIKKTSGKHQVIFLESI